MHVHHDVMMSLWAERRGLDENDNKMNEMRKKNLNLFRWVNAMHVFGIYWVEYLKTVLLLCLPMALPAQFSNYPGAKWNTVATTALVLMIIRSVYNQWLPWTMTFSSHPHLFMQTEWKCFHFRYVRIEFCMKLLWRFSFAWINNWDECLNASTSSLIRCISFWN